jgi:pimeloyl-ACP methyl ester carboxylesterase
MPTLTSSDGTTLTYTTTGTGPSVIIVHGTFSNADSHTELAQSLSSSLTVITYNRRTLSLAKDGAPNPDYTMQVEVADLHAILSATDAHYIFGISSGAIICLETLRCHPSLIQKCALWDPIAIVNNSIDTAFVSRYNVEISEGKTEAALVTAMLGTQLGPAIFRYFPRSFLEWLTRRGIQAQERNKKEENEITLKDLAPTIGYDFKIVEECKNDVERWKEIEAEMLLMAGDKNPGYIKNGAEAVEKVLRNVKKVNFKALNHGAVLNKEHRGKPGPLAEELKKFFCGTVKEGTA